MKKALFWKDFYELSYERQMKKLVKAYQEISLLTGLCMEEIRDNSYSIVVKKEHELFGKVGIYDWISTNRKGVFGKAYFKFKGKRKSVEFNVLDEEEIFSAKNIIMILQREERFRLLFPDAFD